MGDWSVTDVSDWLGETPPKRYEDLSPEKQAEVDVLRARHAMRREGSVYFKPIIQPDGVHHTIELREFGTDKVLGKMDVHPGPDNLNPRTVMQGMKRLWSGHWIAGEPEVFDYDMEHAESDPRLALTEYAKMYYPGLEIPEGVQTQGPGNIPTDWHTQDTPEQMEGLMRGAKAAMWMQREVTGMAQLTPQMASFLVKHVRELADQYGVRLNFNANMSDEDGWYEANEAHVPLMRTDISYLTALHEIGHHVFQSHHPVFLPPDEEGQQQMDPTKGWMTGPQDQDPNLMVHEMKRPSEPARTYEEEAWVWNWVKQQSKVIITPEMVRNVHDCLNTYMDDMVDHAAQRPDDEWGYVTGPASEQFENEWAMKSPVTSGYMQNVWYHVTCRANMQSVKDHGLVPTQHGVSCKNWEEFSIVTGGVYLSPNISSSESYRQPGSPLLQTTGWQEGDAVILRITGLDKRRLHPDPEQMTNSLDDWLDEWRAGSPGDYWPEQFRPLFEALEHYDLDRAGSEAWQAYRKLSPEQQEAIKVYWENMNESWVYLGTIPAQSIQLASHPGEEWGEAHPDAEEMMYNSLDDHDDDYANSYKYQPVIPGGRASGTLAGMTTSAAHPETDWAHLANTIIHNKGGTFNLDMTPYREEAHLVAQRGHGMTERTFPVSEFAGGDELMRYYAAHAPIAEANGLHIGAWGFGDKEDDPAHTIGLDLSRAVTDRTNSLIEAIKHRQRAVFKIDHHHPKGGYEIHVMNDTSEPVTVPHVVLPEIRRELTALGIDVDALLAHPIIDKHDVRHPSEQVPPTV